jgi:hypothetical protein
LSKTSKHESEKSACPPPKKTLLRMTYLTQCNEKKKLFTGFGKLHLSSVAGPFEGFTGFFGVVEPPKTLTTDMSKD